MSNRDFFPLKLRWLMHDAGMHQTDLANAVGVSKSTVSCWLKGKAFPRIDVIQRIADVLGCSTDDLLVENAIRQTRKVLMAFDSAPQSTLDETDEELVELWSNASDTAKQAALAVLKAMEGVK